MTQSSSDSPSASRGDAFQETVATWLSRPVPERAQNQCFDFPAILASDIGLQREENQDRVAALRLSAKHSSQPVVAVVVADGMGGMRDGAKCATLAISSFFYALVRHRHQGLERRAVAAIAHANDAVYAFAGGRGGATFSAVLFDAGASPVIINLGDSRIYACGKGAKVERLTVDDSLEEAVGGTGRELLQFVGMGAGMRPHIRTVPSGAIELALTTDGIHYIDADTLASVLFHAPDSKAAADRLSALARWCGGHDNASMALVDLQALSMPSARGQDGGVQLWDPFGTMAVTWVREISETPRPLAVAAPEANPPAMNVEKPGGYRKERKGGRRPSKKTGQGIRPPKDDVQLEIQIEKSTDARDSDDDSR
ncbi:protein phosphatase 2C domain-containing protein (plasmid) [Xanthobacter dioxanivorans]|uniref:Protein phosphatase 2C domain-containing protein n=1 Tax=Xanthobacter dioxanivorans TaxID=2528964 RepID=A0A974SLJ7_9HYPH|nr:protein phosphatase 2C domain-containing protein [Xanthobacter dioxanivorans]QRG09985.1 protein phosphatase 2C domain-containing protein [Xanthobacter dioxanivorans]